MSASVQVSAQSMKDFQAALKQWSKAMDMDAASALNHQTPYVITNSFKMTKEASVGSIDKWKPSFSGGSRSIKSTVTSGKKKQNKRPAATGTKKKKQNKKQKRKTPKGYNKNDRSKMLIRKLSKKGVKRGQGLKAAVIKEFTSRKRSVGYLKSGWIPAGKAFGVFKFAKNGRGDASLGWGKKAKPSNLVAEFTQFAGGREPDGEKTRRELYNAVSFTMDDEAEAMIAYAQKKMQKSADKHSIGKR